MRIADLSQIDRSTAIYHIAFTVLNGVFNYTALYCLNYYILFFHRLIMPLENFFENFCRNFAKTAPSIRDRSERGRKPTSRCMRGGEQLLELTPSQKKPLDISSTAFAGRFCAKKPTIMSVISRGVPTMRYPFRSCQRSRAPNVCAGRVSVRADAFSCAGL